MHGYLYAMASAVDPRPRLDPGHSSKEVIEQQGEIGAEEVTGADIPGWTLQQGALVFSGHAPSKEVCADITVDDTLKGVEGTGA